MHIFFYQLRLKDSIISTIRRFGHRVELILIGLKDFVFSLRGIPIIRKDFSIDLNRAYKKNSSPYGEMPQGEEIFLLRGLINRAAQWHAQYVGCFLLAPVSKGSH